MKKNIIGLVIVLSFCFFAGCKPTIENKIENEFMDYVQENFDDPSSVDEITNILLVDSCDTKELLNLYATFIKTDTFPKPKYSIYEIKDILDKNASKIKHLPKEKRQKISQLSKQGIELQENLIKFLYTNGDAMDYLKDSINNYISKIDTTNCDLFYTYKIKCRINENNNKKLLEYYAIVNARNGNINIQDHELEIKEVPIVYGIYNQFNLYYKLWNEYYNFKLEETKLLNNFAYELKISLNII